MAGRQRTEEQPERAESEARRGGCTCKHVPKIGRNSDGAKRSPRSGCHKAAWEGREPSVSAWGSVVGHLAGASPGLEACQPRRERRGREESHRLVICVVLVQGWRDFELTATNRAGKTKHDVTSKKLEDSDHGSNLNVRSGTWIKTAGPPLGGPDHSIRKNHTDW